LLLADDALGHRDVDHRHLDMNRRWRIILAPLLLFSDERLALDGGLLADPAVHARLAAGAERVPAPFDAGAHALADLQPRRPGEQRPADSEQREEQQRASIESEDAGDTLSDDMPEDAPGVGRQRRIHPIETQRFDRGA